MSELKYTATQMNNVLSSSQEYYRNWKEAEKINKELRARISELSQAVGLITTLKPTMVMDTEHPLDMAKEVAEYVEGLEAKNENINYFFRRLRMFCIFAHWDNPNTEAEFYKVDAEIREYLSEYKVCEE